MLPRISIITGLSGSGKTIALRALEDCGYSCVDNLPPSLIIPLAETFASGLKDRAKVAVGIDVRERQFLHERDTVLPQLAQKVGELEIVFLEAEVDIILRRFKETRRPHPLMSSESDLGQAIELERELMSSLRGKASRIIDTSRMNPHQLRHHVMSICSTGASPGDDMHVTIMSFGFKYGLPQGADMVFDLRFLPNPHFVHGLRELSGLDNAVRDYVLEKPATSEFIGKVEELMRYLIPQFRKEGRAYLTVAVGCTGGRHRSTAIAEELARRLDEAHLEIKVHHRDL